MTDDNNNSNKTLNNERQSIDSGGVQAFHVPPQFINKTTTIDNNFAKNNYHLDQIFTQPKFHSFSATSGAVIHSQPMALMMRSIANCIIKIYQDVVNTIKQNCRMYLHNAICQTCKEVNLLLEGGQEPTSMDDVWSILCTKYNMI